MTIQLLTRSKWKGAVISLLYRPILRPFVLSLVLVLLIVVLALGPEFLDTGLDPVEVGGDTGVDAGGVGVTPLLSEARETRHLHTARVEVRGGEGAAAVALCHRQTDRQAYRQTDGHTDVWTDIQSHTHTHRQTDTHARTHAHTCTHIRTHARTHARTHTHTHT